MYLFVYLFIYGYKYLKIARRKHPDCLVDSCKYSSINQMAAGGCPGSVMEFSFFTYFSNILCVVNLKVLGLKAY